MASVPQSETYQDFTVSEDPITALPTDFSGAKTLFTDKNIWPRLPVKLRKAHSKERRYKVEIPKLFDYVELGLEKDIEILFSPKKTKKAYGEDLSTELNEFRAGDEYLPTNIITKDPGFKEKVKQKYLALQLGLSELERSAYIKSNKYDKKDWGTHGTLMRVANSVVYDEIASKHIAPLMQEGLNDIVSPDSTHTDATKEFAKNLLIDTKFDTSSPEFQPIIESVMKDDEVFSFSYSYQNKLDILTPEAQDRIRKSKQEWGEDFANTEQLVREETNQRLFGK